MKKQKSQTGVEDRNRELDRTLAERKAAIAVVVEDGIAVRPHTYEAERLLRYAEKMGLQRNPALHVASAIAFLDNSARIETVHLAEALQYQQAA